jgi:hypothetical protein
MANEIYNSSWWGFPSATGWGNIYYRFANSIAQLIANFTNRVTGSGGAVEATEFIEQDNNASFMLQPSGYNNGVLHAIIPEDGSGDLNFSRIGDGTRINAQGIIDTPTVGGGELITNGTFETIIGDDVFNPNQFFGNANSVTDGVYEIDITNSNPFGFQMTLLPFEPDTRYRIDWEVIETTVTSGNFAVWNGSGSATTFGDLTQAGNTGTIYKDGVVSAFNGDVRGNTLSNGTIKFRLTVKEVTEGYIDDTELITNGGFDDGLNGWQVNDGASGIDITLDNGQVRFITDGAGGGIQQNGFLEVGKTYQIEFDYTAIEGGIKIVPYFLDISETKRYSGIFEATSTLFSFYRNNTYGDTEGLIDNISVKEVVQDNWNVGTNMSISNGKLISTGSNFGAQLKQTILENNKEYKLTFDIVEGDYVSGKIGIVSVYYDKQVMLDTEGTHTVTFNSLNQTEFRLYSENFIGSIDNISVKQVIEDSVPRLNYDSIEYANVLGSELITNGEFDGEVESTNLVEYSEDFSDSSWNKSYAAAIESNSINSPEGVLNATKFKSSITGTAFAELRNDTQSGKTLSIFAKSGEVKQIMIFAVGSITQGIYFNLDDGSFSSYYSLSTKISNYSSESFGDGWYRYEITFTEVFDSFKLFLAENDSITFPLTLGHGIYIYGAQLEALPYATSYIPTLNGVPESRVDDTGWITLDAILKDGSVTIGIPSGGISQFGTGNILESGKTYNLSYEVLEDNGGSFSIASPNMSLDTTLGVHNVKFTTSGSSLFIKRSSSSTTTPTTFDNMSIKEITGQEIVSSGKPSVLLEPESTNLVQYSEDFSQSSWTESNSTVTSNYGISPRGIQDSTRLQLTSSLFSRVDTICVATAPANKQHTVSCWVKSNGNDTEFRLKCTNRGVLDYYSTNLVATNEWQRFTFTQLFGPIAGNDIIAGVVNGTSNNSADLSIYGFQLEQALPYATSYIPTDGAPESRLAETLERDNISHLINSEEGVLYVEGKRTVIETFNDRIALKSSSTGDYVQVLIANTSVGGRCSVGGFQALLGENTDTQSDYVRVAFAWKKDDFKLYLNEVEVDSDPSGNVPVGLDKLKVSNSFYGALRDIRIYKSIEEAQKELSYIN